METKRCSRCLQMLIMTWSYTTAAGPCQELHGPCLFGISGICRSSIFRSSVGNASSIINAKIFVHLLDISRVRRRSSIQRVANLICRVPIVRHHDRQLKEEEGEQEERLPGKHVQDFYELQSWPKQKPKLKVGKARPKAANSTDTSFRAKCETYNTKFHILN